MFQRQRGTQDSPTTASIAQPIYTCIDLYVCTCICVEYMSVYMCAHICTRVSYHMSIYTVLCMDEGIHINVYV